MASGMGSRQSEGPRVRPEPSSTPTVPAPVEVKAPPPTVETPGPPPKIETTNTPEVPSTVAVIPNPPGPKPKKKPQRKPVTTVPGTAQAPPTAAAQAETAPPVLKLGEVVSDDQKAQLQRNCDESLTRAREAL